MRVGELRLQIIAFASHWRIQLDAYAEGVAHYVGGMTATFIRTVVIGIDVMQGAHDLG